MGAVVRKQVERPRAEIEAERKRIEAMPDGPEKDAALAALALKEAELAKKEKELAMLKDYAEARHGKMDAKGDALSAAIEANGGKLPVEMLDGMSMDAVDDLIKSKESEVERLRAEIEAERKRIEAMPDGP